MDPKSHSDAISWLAGSGLGTFVSPRKYSSVNGLRNAHTNKEAILEEHRQEVLQAANVAKDWDIHVHLRALDAEFGKIEGSRS
jgi:DNA-binding GntR family transcriptional regulator